MGGAREERPAVPVKGKGKNAITANAA
jgi:hypothetical protein